MEKLVDHFLRASRENLAPWFILLCGLLAVPSAQAACSSYQGKVVFNEVYDPTSGTTSVELKVLDPSVVAASSTFAGWSVNVYKKTGAGAVSASTANFGTAFTTAAQNSCGQQSAWVRVPDSALGGMIAGSNPNSNLNFVLSENGKIVDVLRLGSATTLYTVGTSFAACPGIEGVLPSSRYDAAWGINGNKDWYRTLDGTGTWGGQATASGGDSICGSNDGGSTFAVSKVASVTSVPVNTNFSFTLYAQNGAGGSALTGVQVTDDLTAAGLNFVSCTTASGSCTYSGGVVTWSVGAVAANTTKTAILTVTASSAGAKTNTINSNVGTPAATASATVQAYAPLADWHMDESLWNGTVGEVKDSSGNGYHGRARIAAGSSTVATTASGSPAYTSGSQNTCNYGQFDRTTAPTRTYSYVELSGIPTLPSSFTFAAWVRSTNATAQHQRILVRDDGDNGWGLSLADGTGQGKLRFFNRNITNSGAVTGQGSNPGAGVFALDTDAVITSNNWFFIAASINTTGKIITLYVYNAAGTLLATTSSAFAGTWADGTGLAAIGGETSASSEGRQTSWHFLGNIDEVQIYSGVLSQTDLDVLRTRARNCGVVGPEHIELVHNGAALNCTPKAVTVLACTGSASCNGVPASQYTGGSFTFAPTPISGAQWCSDALCASPISGAVTLSNNATIYLREPTARTDTLGGSTSSASNATVQCTNAATSAFNATTACEVAFASAGFLMNAANHYACSPQIMTLQAVKSSATGTSCIPAFAGVNRDVKLYLSYTNPATGTQTASLNYVTSSGGASSTVASLSTSSGSPSTLGGLYFDGTGTATISNFSYPDAGQVMLNPSYTGSAGTGDAGLSLVAISGNSFIAAPKSFVFSAIPTAPLTAGDPFNVTVTAYNACSTPAPTPNFGQETTAATVSLTSSNPIPAMGNATAISQTLAGFANGAASINLTWAEVGTVDLVATSSNYLGSALNTSSTQSAVGRFKPAYLDTKVTQGCSTFTYSGQPFTAEVTAMARGGTITANYAGATWAKLVTLSDANGGSGTFSNNTIAATAFSAGVGSNNTVSYKFASSLTAPASIGLRATDTDSVSSTGHVEGSTNLRSGRLRLFNTYGSERMDLSMPLELQYYNGSSFVRNTADTCTSLGVANVNLVNYQGGITATNMGLSHVTAVAPFAAGLGSVTLSKPSPASTLLGSLDLILNLGSMGAPVTCPTATPVNPLGSSTSAAKPYLSGNWCGAAAYDRDPSARATFGVYKSPLIYRRENY